MKILMQSRVNLFTVPGGDTVQVVKTKEYLEKEGVKVDLTLELEPDVSGYDVVHLFNFWRIQETYIQALNAKKYGKPVVLSTIYWNNEELEREAFGGWRQLVNRALPIDQVERLKGLWRLIKDGEKNKATMSLITHGRQKLQEKVLPLVDCFLPNALGEMELLMKDFNFPTESFVVVPNAVDPEVFNPEKAAGGGRFTEYAGCVLCVARIEPRKNQLRLVESLKGSGLPLVLAGKPAPNHMKYYQEIKEIPDAKVTFLGPVPHEELPALYSVAKVHVLPSWFETPGLSSLEAAVMGSNTVITAKGTTREYFGELAWYCDPLSVESIREAVLQAYESPSSEELREKILTNFTWKNTALKTMEGYRKVL